MTAPSAPNPASAQTVLQFTDLENPQDVAVDAEGNVYVADLHQFQRRQGISRRDDAGDQAGGRVGSRNPAAVALGGRGDVMAGRTDTVWP
jgi:hypothetical protein